ncbi:HAMP domain-containing histidine kinase [bacterium]|nr:HAMP domain-containing histidine kinase [bacterium]MBU1989388.1 HAMP domain-containing histidine kinase [bacterium]
MKFKINNFFTSGYVFDDSNLDLKSRYEIINIIILMSIVGLLYGIIGNIMKDIKGLIALEFSLIAGGLVMLYVLRAYRGSFKYIVEILTFEYTIFFLYLIYIGEPGDLKHSWIFTYPIILLNLQKPNKARYWLALIVGLLILAPIQNLVEVNYSLFQVTYISFVVLLISLITYFYNNKMTKAISLILEQQSMLKNFNTELEKQVKDKTSELIELNELLEIKVQEKIDQLIQKDKLLTTQSKQAVMGEMISMIAHQWRQPLSTITLQIANYQLKQLMDQNNKTREVDKTLSEISDTIIYLSDTIDDFKTYFHPDKERGDIEIGELLQRALNLTMPRLKNNNIKVSLEVRENIIIHTYINELIQVVLNLLNNAIDALLEASKENLNISIRVEDKGREICLSVIDNAYGIAKENVEHIFEPYFSTKGKNGTGLGLYMSQMIIQKQFGGDIDVESSKKGTTFIIRIPKTIS